MPSFAVTASIAAHSMSYSGYQRGDQPHCATEQFIRLPGQTCDDSIL
ncbi:hypothetical protein [Streptomyces sannanensis]